MKKLLLSFSVIFLFLVYGRYQKQQVSNVQVTQPVIQTPTGTPPIVNRGENEDDSNGRVVAPIINSPTPQPSVTGIPVQTTSQYKDGEYTGNPADALYGNIQVKAVISGGKITDVQFLQYPSDRGTSIEINTQAMPFLKQEAIAAQSSQVDIVSGATDTSQAFIQSLGSALAKAK